MTFDRKKWVETLRRWRLHPAQFVRELFGVTPYPWQEKVLEAFPNEQRIAMQACKGPGKTAVEAWLGWNFLCTRDNPKIAATSISGDNLRDNLWAEMALWRQKSPWLQQRFEWTSTRIFSRQYPETWWMSARTWPKSGDSHSQANTLAGLHAEYIMFILDESGGIPESVMVSAEAALSSCKEGHIVQAGNPTHLEGPLYRASNNRKENGGLWHVVEITGDPDDPMRAPKPEIQWARDQIKTYGRDNPWVLVNVFGKFPPSSLNALIGYEEVKEAMKRHYKEHEYGRDAKVMAADVARHGDDASVIARKQGLQMFPFERYRNLTSDEGAAIVNREWSTFNADACFIDATGGFGWGWIDQLRLLGRSAIPVTFSNKAHNEVRFANKRTEMYFDFIEKIRHGLALPDSDPLARQLAATTYTFKGDALILEDKTMIKAKLAGMSPDEADAAAMLFAEPISPQTRTLGRAVARSAITPGYDPFREVAGGRLPDYDPFGSP